MKKLLLTVFAIAVAFVSANAQACAAGAPSCLPQGTQNDPGFENPFNVPCAEKGVSYTYNVQFKMFTDFNFQGQQSVDSIEFVSVNNLPCGLCWNVDQADKRYLANEDGCLHISGTTNDAAGQYEFNIVMKAWINGGPTAINVPASLTKQAGIRYFLRVKDAGGNCAALDTSANATYQTANAANCSGTGINDIVSEVSGLQLMPNPVTNQATINFIAANSGVYTFTVTDVTGKTVNTKQVDVYAGTNTTTIERNGLPVGSYFLIVNDGKTNVTRRFTVAD